jgi:probable addiction module antidote protein
VIEVRHYVSRAGKDVFDDWLTHLADAHTQAKIAGRINRLAAGNFGDCKPLRQGVSELRIDWGAGLPGLLRHDRQGMRRAPMWWRQTNTVFRDWAGVAISQRLQRKGRNRMKSKASISHDETIVRRLRKNPDFAAEYLKAALEDEDEPRVLLIALRHLAQAQGIAKVAKEAGIERESLYRALSVHGNPRLSTLVAVTRAIGLRLTVEAAH